MGFLFVERWHDARDERRREMADETGPKERARGRRTTGDQPSLPSIRPRGLSNPFTPAAPADPVPREAPPARKTRYLFDSCIGRGGMGEVWLSTDLRLNREVAIKLVRPERATEARAVNAIVHEARLTARVEHPNVVPVHDIGVTEDGRVFYTMKRVHGQSLSHILRAQAKNDPKFLEEYSLIKLLGILRQVCLAVAFVHSKGVLHRDLKPSNIMIGDFGEVVLIDWGLARLKIKKEGEPPEPTSQRGLVQGTPAYMAPEQAKYGLPGTDERSDVYSLGAILYQTLVLRPPYRRRKGETLEAYMRRIIGTQPPAPAQVAPDREIPADLAALALRCMSKEAEDRVPDARALALELELHIEGKKAEAKRDADATDRVRRALEAVDRYRKLQEQLEEERQEIHDASVDTPAWAEQGERETVYRLEERSRKTTREVAETFGEAVRHFHEALTYRPGDRRARLGLADLYWERFLAAEAAGDEADRIQYEALIRHFGEARYADRIAGEGTLEVHTTPSDLEVVLSTVREVDRRLVAEQPRSLGTTPLGPLELATGRYLLTVAVRDDWTIHRPVFMQRAETVIADLRADLEPPEGFLLIPGGTFAYGPLPGEPTEVPSYAISRYPLTFVEYLEFINDLDARDRFEAWQRLPRSERLPGHRWVRGDDGYVLDVPDLVIDRRSPVVGVSHEDAEAYCRWRTEREALPGRTFLLPTEHQWEKAARGPDRRLYPWGNAFDPAYCLMRDTREHGAHNEPVGSVEADCSPYGVHDLAGHVREWCRGWFAAGVGQRPIRGGSWLDPPQSCLCTLRRGSHPATTADNIGFRLVVEFDEVTGDGLLGTRQ